MDKTEIWIRLIDGLILIASLLVLLSLISWAQAHDEEDRQATERSYAAMLAACMNTQRNFIGFEMDKSYYDIACDRIERLGCAHD